jgi:hypothetical protein
MFRKNFQTELHRAISLQQAVQTEMQQFTLSQLKKQCVSVLT